MEPEKRSIEKIMFQYHNNDFQSAYTAQYFSLIKQKIILVAILWWEFLCAVNQFLLLWGDIWLMSQCDLTSTRQWLTINDGGNSLLPSQACHHLVYSICPSLSQDLKHGSTVSCIHMQFALEIHTSLHVYPWLSLTNFDNCLTQLSMQVTCPHL